MGKKTRHYTKVQKMEQERKYLRERQIHNNLKKKQKRLRHYTFGGPCILQPAISSSYGITEFPSKKTINYPKTNFKASNSKITYGQKYENDMKICYRNIDKNLKPDWQKKLNQRDPPWCQYKIRWAASYKNFPKHSNKPGRYLGGYYEYIQFYLERTFNKVMCKVECYERK